MIARKIGKKVGSACFLLLQWWHRDTRPHRIHVPLLVFVPKTQEHNYPRLLPSQAHQDKRDFIPEQPAVEWIWGYPSNNLVCRTQAMVRMAPPVVERWMAWTTHRVHLLPTGDPKVQNIASSEGLTPRPAPVPIKSGPVVHKWCCKCGDLGWRCPTHTTKKPTQVKGTLAKRRNPLGISPHYLLCRRDKYIRRNGR